jgi:hypothetical protein
MYSFLLLLSLIFLFGNREIIYAQGTNSVKNPILSIYFEQTSNRIWFNRADRSVQFFDLITNEIDTLNHAKAESFFDYGSHFILLNNNQIQALNKTTFSLKTVSKIPKLGSGILTNYHQARNNRLLIVTIRDFIDYQATVFDFKSGKKEELSDKSFENIVDIHEDQLGNYWLTDNNLYRFNKETNEWMLFLEKTKETDWLKHIRSTKNNLYVSTWNSLILKFDIMNPEKDVSILSNVAPFNFKTFDVSQNGTIAVTQDRRIAWLKNGDWTEVPSHKLDKIEGEIHHIQFIDEKKVLINTGYSFGVVNLSE